MAKRFNFSVHAIDQMSLRLGDTIDLETRLDLMDLLEEISNKEVYELVGDPVVLNDKNRKGSTYYLIDFNRSDVQTVLYDHGYNYEEFEGILGVFVVREGCCVTFKTNTESEIFSNLKELYGSTRVRKERGFRKNYEF